MKILIPEIIQGLGSSFLRSVRFFAETVLGGQYKIQEARLKNSTDFAPELVQTVLESITIKVSGEFVIHFWTVRSLS